MMLYILFVIALSSTVYFMLLSARQIEERDKRAASIREKIARDNSRSLNDPRRLLR